MTETGNITRKDNTKLLMFFFVSNCYKQLPVCIKDRISELLL